MTELQREFPATNENEPPIAGEAARAMVPYVVTETARSKQTSPEPASIQSRAALTRALICGYVDSYTLINFGVYASFMSGNTTSGGADAGRIQLDAAGHNLLPIPFFVLGIFVGTLVLRGDHDRRLNRVSVVVVVMLLFCTVAELEAWPGWISIVVLSSGMGILNTSITRVGGQSVSVGFVTGDLNNLAQHIAAGVRRDPVQQPAGPWDTHWRRASLLARVWGTFLIGAVLGAAVASRFGAWTLLLPAILLLLLAILQGVLLPARN